MVTVKLYACKKCNKTMIAEVFADEATTVEIMKQNPTCNDCTENHTTNIDSLTHYVARHEWTGEPILETTPDGAPFWKCNRALEKVATTLLDELGRDYTTSEISDAWDDYNWTLRELSNS